MPQIYDMGPTALLPLRRKAYWGFFRPKNPTASAGFEPANLGTKGQPVVMQREMRVRRIDICGAPRSKMFFFHISRKCRDLKKKNVIERKICSDFL